MQTTAARPVRHDDQAEGRRTVVITGHPVPARRRPPRAQAQIQARPDRVAMWAFALGIFLVLMAVVTASA